MKDLIKEMNFSLWIASLTVNGYNDKFVVIKATLNTINYHQKRALLIDKKLNLETQF